MLIHDTAGCFIMLTACLESNHRSGHEMSRLVGLGPLLVSLLLLALVAVQATVTAENENEVRDAPIRWR